MKSKLYLNLRQGICPLIPILQYDDGKTFYIFLDDYNIEYDAVVKAEVQKPNNDSAYFLCAYHHNEIIWDIKSGADDVVGINKIIIHVIVDDKDVTQYRFKLNVQKNNVADSGAWTSDAYNNFKTSLDKIDRPSRLEYTQQIFVKNREVQDTLNSLKTEFSTWDNNWNQQITDINKVYEDYKTHSEVIDYQTSMVDKFISDDELQKMYDGKRTPTDTTTTYEYMEYDVGDENGWYVTNMNTLMRSVPKIEKITFRPIENSNDEQIEYEEVEYLELCSSYEETINNLKLQHAAKNIEIYEAINNNDYDDYHTKVAELVEIEQALEKYKDYLKQVKKYLSYYVDIQPSDNHPLFDELYQSFEYGRNDDVYYNEGEEVYNKQIIIDKVNNEFIFKSANAFKILNVYFTNNDSENVEQAYINQNILACPDYSITNNPQSAYGMWLGKTITVMDLDELVANGITMYIVYCEYTINNGVNRYVSVNEVTVASANEYEIDDWGNTLVSNKVVS